MISQEDLGLITAANAKRFCIELSGIFVLNQTEARTFARVAEHLKTLCLERLKHPNVFIDAIQWAKDAKRSNAEKPKALFMSKVKKETGFTKQRRLLANV